MSDDDMLTNCKTCKRKLEGVAFMCDQESDGAYCVMCWSQSPCETVPHDEGCPTKVFLQVKL